MKILFISSSFYPAFSYGGSVEANYNLLTKLAKKVGKIKVLTLDVGIFGKNGSFPIISRSWIKKSSLEIKYCHHLFLKAVSWELICELFHSIPDSDLVYIGEIYSFPAFMGIIVAKIFRKPLILFPHGSLQRDKTTRRVFLKSVWNRICLLFLPSKTIIQLSTEFEAKEASVSMPNIPTIVFPNLISLSERSELKKERGETFKFLYLGRIDPKKGIENLIEALSILENQNWTLVIVGRGNKEYEESIKNLIHKKGLDDKIKMIGFIDPEDKIDWFSSSDITVVPSFKENFCHVVAESLSAGIPVIVSDQIPWKEVEEVGCGLVSSNEPAELSKALKKAFTLPLREMGEKGRKWISDFYQNTNVEELSKRLEEFVAS